MTALTFVFFNEIRNLFTTHWGESLSLWFNLQKFILVKCAHVHEDQQKSSCDCIYDFSTCYAIVRTKLEEASNALK